MSTSRKVAGRFVQVVAWFVIATFVAAIVVAVLVPRIAGATPYTILTGSMQPKYPPGTLVVIKPTAVKDIDTGMVVTYQLESGKPTVVTHRVVRIGITANGDTIFTTQGDANNAPDPKPVLPVQIKGKLWYHVPYLGYVNEVITGKERRVTTVVVVSALLVYASYMFTTSVRERRSTRKKEEVSV